MTASLSRFAVLRIDGDEDEKAAQRARDKQRSAAQKSTNNKKEEKARLNADKIVAKKSKAAQERAELKALAFGIAKPKKSSSSKKKSTTEIPAVDWNEWKQRDQEFVEGCFETQLKEALIASKVDFEENKKEKSKQVKKEESIEKPPKKKSGNKKGTTTMTLDQFKQGPQAPPKETAVHDGTNGNADHDDEHFFEHVADEAKKIASKERNKTEMAKKSAKKQKEAQQLNNEPRLAQLHEELSQKNLEIENLTSENEKLREELLNVKTRNKRLCNILVQGEMKEKAELIIEMEKISKVKDELTAELENLSSQLQQERSKVTALTDVKKIAAQKKRTD